MDQSRNFLSRRHLLTAAAGVTAGAAVSGLAAPALAKAPALGSSRPAHYRFKLGRFEVTTILDAGALLDGPWPIVGEDHPKEEVAQLMTANLLPTQKFQPGFTPTVVNTGDQLILFDAGNGAKGFVPRPDGGWLANQLLPAGFTPEQIDVVVVTHAHPDHIGGLHENNAPLFPNARYVIGGVENAFWSNADRLLSNQTSLEHQSAMLFRAHLSPHADRTSFIKPGDDVVPGVRAVEAYGHTPGHLAFHVESDGKSLLIWGDCAHHQIASLARPAWHALFDMDKEQGAATRKRIYAMAATDRIAIIGYHLPFPSVGFIEQAETGYRWIPNSYQLL
jgi:glyoxylase-like metal-dependent hydrolase (beta-lactamase superfamily II)